MAGHEVTFVISDEVLDALREIAEQRGTTLPEALKWAIATQRLILQEASAGGHIVIRKPGQAPRELVLT